MKSYALFLKSLKEKPISSGAATVLAFPNRHRVLPEFCIKPPPPLSPFEGRANLFASFLLALWVPVQPNERTNFLPIYQLLNDASLSEVNLNNAAGPVTQINPGLLAPLWAQGNTQNLGALLFLNCLMSRNVDHDTLGLIISPITGNPFFTQKLSSFWFNYFQYPRKKHLFSYTLSKSVSCMLEQLSQPNHDWWQRAGLYSKGNQNDVNLLLYNAFESILRVCLTPESLIEQMIQTIFGTTFYTHEFECHVKNQINNVRKDILKCLNKEQKIAWKTMLQTDGARYLEAYQASLANFHLWQKEPFTGTTLKKIQMEMQALAQQFISIKPIFPTQNIRPIINDDIHHWITEEDEDEDVEYEITSGAFILTRPEQNEMKKPIRRARSFSFFNENENNSHEKENIHREVYLKIDKNQAAPDENVLREQVTPPEYTA